MFPHTITIYTHSIKDGQDYYSKQVLDGFYWHEKTARALDGKGDSDSAEVVVISSLKRAKEYYAGKWDVKVGDIIIKGKGGNITTVKELKDFHKVTTVSINICGSCVDNISITGK